MSRINNDNFLRWDGSFPRATFSNHAVTGIGYTCSTGFDYVNCDILANDSSTYGIDRSTVEVVSASVPDFQWNWLPNTQFMRIFRGAGYALNPSVTFYYRWKDRLGNYSNIQSETVAFT